jgi:hypothetical protein
MRKKAVIAYFEALFWHSPGPIKEQRDMFVQDSVYGRASAEI